MKIYVQMTRREAWYARRLRRMVIQMFDIASVILTGIIGLAGTALVLLASAADSLSIDTFFRGYIICMAVIIAALLIKKAIK